MMISFPNKNLLVPRVTNISVLHASGTYWIASSSRRILGPHLAHTLHSSSHTESARRLAANPWFNRDGVGRTGHARGYGLLDKLRPALRNVLWLLRHVGGVLPTQLVRFSPGV